MPTLETLVAQFARCVSLFRDPSVKDEQKKAFRALLALLPDTAVTLRVAPGGAGLEVNGEPCEGDQLAALVQRLDLHGIGEIALPAAPKPAHLFVLLQALADQPGAQDVASRVASVGADRIRVTPAGSSPPATPGLVASPADIERPPLKPKVDAPVDRRSRDLGTKGILRGDAFRDIESVPLDGVPLVTHDPPLPAAADALPATSRAPRREHTPASEPPPPSPRTPPVEPPPPPDAGPSASVPPPPPEAPAPRRPPTARAPAARGAELPAGGVRCVETQDRGDRAARPHAGPLGVVRRTQRGRVDRRAGDGGRGSGAGAAPRARGRAGAQGSGNGARQDRHAQRRRAAAPRAARPVGRGADARRARDWGAQIERTRDAARGRDGGGKGGGRGPRVDAGARQDRESRRGAGADQMGAAGGPDLRAPAERAARGRGRWAAPRRHARRARHSRRVVRRRRPPGS